MLIQQILVGAGMIVTGSVALKFNFQLGNLVPLVWIESKIGNGTTFMVYKILSVLIVLGGVLTIAGLGDNVVRWAVSPLEGAFRQN